MKKITLFILVIISGIIFSNCNKDDDNVRTSTDSIVGTWKLIEEYTDGTAVSLNDCLLQETYIFGADQFTHEIYSNTSGRFSQFGGDDDDDESSDDEDDNSGSDDDEDDDHSGSDDEGSDEGSDEGTDEGDDDDGPVVGECLIKEQKIGFWTIQGSNNYTLTIENLPETLVINFLDNSNKFYYEKTVTVNGVQKVKRYVYQRQ
ncbi:hypothetical protein [uncultured Flavobacterium sp.]|uniref:hypothetical protein n=1 Tax=uncultured Flavobacterium sp. TaxID=165435 RepID=UPI0025ECA2B1|nr:hypothetical protein [uncultured Flavobacterium sp.]